MNPLVVILLILFLVVFLIVMFIVIYRINNPPPTISPIDDQQIDYPPINNQQMDYPPINNQQMDYPPMDSQEMDYPPMDGQEMDYPPMNGQEMDYPPMDGQEMDYPPINNQMNVPPINNQQINVPPINNQMSVPPVINQPANNFDQTILELHNQARKNHGVSPLQWDQTLADQSKKWADYICRGNCDGSQIGHSNYPTVTMKLGDGNYGENVAWNMNSAGINDVVAANSAVDGWYKEYPCYDYNNPRFSGNSGHFTQVVWKDTTKVGCAYSMSPDKTKVMTVCQYTPRGNLNTRASFSANVLPCLNNCPNNKC